MNTDHILEPKGRKQILIQRMLKTIEQWQKLKDSSIKIQILSAKYSRSLKDLGGFPEVIEELEEKGIICIELEETGARLVSLGKKSSVQTNVQLLEKTKLYF